MIIIVIVYTMILKAMYNFYHHWNYISGFVEMSRIIELITTRIVYYLSNQRFMSPKIPAIASFTLPPLEQHALDYVRVIITTN